ncbi:MAG: threonine aldolase [Salinibacterium sp.]|nr:threonine aldolase [Salinibacterium sp.]
MAPPTQLHDPNRRGFGSDNQSGVHAEILEAIISANGGHVGAYGEDPYTERLQEVIADRFGVGAEAFPVLTGTGGNVIALQSMIPRWGSVLCSASAHVNTDENGAAESVAGIKLMPIASDDGKLSPELIHDQSWRWGSVHRGEPLAITITQSTELGTAYTADEIAAIADYAHSHDMGLHIDGARLSNAAAHLGLSLKELTMDVGADTVSFGGTKNGLLFGEAIVSLTPGSLHGFSHLRKADMQLASKMRFISAQLIALLETDLWLTSASHANAMASRLAEGVRGMPGVEITQKVQSNAVFAILPPGIFPQLSAIAYFDEWNPFTREVRWVCSFDTTEADVDRFVAGLAALLA